MELTPNSTTMYPAQTGDSRLLPQLQWEEAKHQRPVPSSGNCHQAHNPCRKASRCLAH